MGKPRILIAAIQVDAAVSRVEIAAVQPLGVGRKVHGADAEVDAGLFELALE